MMTGSIVTRRHLQLVATAVVGLAIATGTTASAESPDGWTATGSETKVFVCPRDDGRTVGVHVRPAKKGSDEGILVRVTLTGFSDKRVAFQADDLSELFGLVFRPMANRPNKNTTVKRSASFWVGDFEDDVRTSIVMLLQDSAAAKALDVRGDAVAGARTAGGDLAQRFTTANAKTIQAVAGGSRGQVVRAIHTALMAAGAK